TRGRLRGRRDDRRRSVRDRGLEGPVVRSTTGHVGRHEGDVAEEGVVRVEVTRGDQPEGAWPVEPGSQAGRSEGVLDPLRDGDGALGGGREPESHLHVGRRRERRRFVAQRWSPSVDPPASWRPVKEWTTRGKFEGPPASLLGPGCPRDAAPGPVL